MPIYRHFDKEGESFPEMNTWRYWCDCGDPLHVLEIDEIGDSTTLSIIIGHKMSFWRRFKLALKLIFKGEACYHDVCITEQDRKELAAILNKEIVK
jgi:hypothetical protein